MVKKHNPKTIYQKDLIAKIVADTSLSKRKAQQVIAAFKSIMLDTLASGEHIQLREFGSFSVKERKSHTRYSIKEKGIINIPPKKCVKFSKSSQWKLPEVKAKRKVKRSGEGLFLEKKQITANYRKKLLVCDDNLNLLYYRLIQDNAECLPYVWKLLITKQDYCILKKSLKDAISEYKENKKDIKKLLILHANLLIIYIAEWYKREYSNFRGDINNDPLRQLEFTGATSEYNLIWQYSSPVFDIQRFLYKSKMTNRTKHSLYILGGIPLQFESKKLRAIIFNSVNVSNDDNEEDILVSETDKEEDSEFLLENTYLRESLDHEDGSLRLFVEELKTGDYLDLVKDDEDYNAFIANYLDFQNKYFRQEKFRSDWLLYYSKGCGILDRVLRVTLRNEYSDENNNMYISGYRLHKWGISTENLRDFDICVKFDQGKPIKLFHFSCVGRNNYSCWNNKDFVTIEDVPPTFNEGHYLVRLCDGTNRIYNLPLKPIKFNDINLFLKTSKNCQWTSNTYINSTEVALLYDSTRYKVIDNEPYETLKTENGRTYSWLPFSGSITVKNKFTRETEEYNSKIGHLDISLEGSDNLSYTILHNSVLVNNGDGTFNEVPIYIKNGENILRFSEYDYQRGMCISDKLETFTDVEITICQNGKKYNYTDGIRNLCCGLFTVVCSRKNKSAQKDFFCLRRINDVERNLDEGTISFNWELKDDIGDIIPVDHNISCHRGHFYDDITRRPAEETIMFRSEDNKYRFPVYRCCSDAYIVYFNGVATTVDHDNINGVAHLYISDDRQKDITKINHISENGVNGVHREDIIIESFQRKNIIANHGLYKFSIGDDIANYKFVAYSISQNIERNISPLLQNGEYCIECLKDEIVVHVILPTSRPKYRYVFQNKDININDARSFAKILCFFRKYGMENICFDSIDFAWLLGRSEKEEVVADRLPEFINEYISLNNFNFATEDYKLMHSLEERCNFVWMFLLPTHWYKYCQSDSRVKEILLKLFTYGYEDNKYLRMIGESVLSDILYIKAGKKWVQHKRNSSFNKIGQLAAEYLMPITVQKGKRKMSEKSVNTKNIEEYMYRNLDPKNMTIGRSESFTSKFYKENKARSFRDNLKDSNCITLIYNYLKQLNFIK